MSGSYCVLLGEMEAPSSIARNSDGADHLTLVFAKGSVRVFASADVEHFPLPDGCGIILGSIFARGDPHRAGAQALSKLPSRADRARWLIDNIWGRYLAVLVVDDDGRNADILRDPIGLYACYCAQRHDVTAFASDARVLRTFGLIGGSIDWQHAALPLAYPDYRSLQTGLIGVTEPTPGEVVHWNTGTSFSQSIWSPTKYCLAVPPDGFDRCADAVRARVDETVSAWAGSAEKLLLSLSGGLDSSIIATSIPSPSGRLFAFNLRSGNGRGDERDHAHLVADTISIPLEIFDIRHSDVDLQISIAADLPRASARSFTQAVDRLATDLAQVVGADAHINGGGGDNVFAFLHSANPAADRLRVEGLGPGFIRTVFDLADLTHCTPLHVARRAVTKSWFKPDRFDWPIVPDLLTRDYLEALPSARHPWFADEGRLRPGQRQHVGSILRAAYLSAFLNIRDRRPTFYPLLSQPLVELCLSIPTWLCCRDGRDRAVARAAFADRVPPAILDRRSKGAFEGLIGTIYERHRPLMREMILDGGLVRNGIVSREAAEQALQSPFADGDYSARLLQCVDVEAWATSWG